MELPEKLKLDDVPFFQQKDEFDCVPASILMVLKYLLKREIPEGEVLELYRICRIRSGDGTPWDPPQLKSRFEDVYPNINIEQKTNSNLDELKRLLAEKKIPPIVHFSAGIFYWDTPVTSDHAAVVVGYSNELLFVNDPDLRSFHGLEISQFIKSWEAANFRITILSLKNDDKNE
jgi:ABC-type bacteriocin/lantibiotic exporter with double-glycine peptidase domain